jgi:hypothetical protein
VPEEQQQLANWTGLKPKELALVLKDCTDATESDKAAACELLVQCLQSKPERRPTMEAVLNFPFFSGHEAGMELVLKHLDIVMKRQVEHHEVQVEHNEVMIVKVDALAEKLEQAKVCVTILACQFSSHTQLHDPNSACPRVNYDFPQESLMRGMLSVSESEFPALFILVKPDVVHTFLDSKGIPWFPNASKFKLPGYDIFFLCIVCQLTGRVKHKPVELKIPSKKLTDFMRKAATPIKIACALLRLGLVVAKVAGAGLVPIPDSILSSIETMGTMCDEACEFGTNAVTFADVCIAENELGEKVNTQVYYCYANVTEFMFTSIFAQSGLQKMNKLDQLKEQMQSAEQNADVKTSRLLLELFEKFSDVKGTDGLAVKRLANLYRCIHKDQGTVIWICEDADAVDRAEKLGFRKPDLHAGLLETDEPEAFQGPDSDVGFTGASASPIDTEMVGQGDAKSKGCTIL